MPRFVHYVPEGAMEMTIHINANPLETGNDELERYALEECVKRQRLDHRVSILVIPAGHGEVAAKFAGLGAHVLLGDVESQRREIEEQIQASGLGDRMRFATFGLAAVPETLPDEPFDIIVLNRGLCGMPYEEGRKTLRQLLLKLRIGGKLYVSVLGLHSELGDGYTDHEQPIEERYGKLSPAMAQKYGIASPLCLYTERNLFMLLLEAGASVLRTMTTTYGNVKGVAVRV